MPIKENPSMEDVLMLGDTLDVNNPKSITLQQIMDIAGEKVSSVEVVDELPAEGRENKLYIKKISQDDTYVYESYIWDDNAYHQMSNGGGGGGDSVWEKDSNNNIFPKGNTDVTGTNCFVTGLTSKADNTNCISIGNGNESKAWGSIVIGTNVKDFDPSGDALSWQRLIAMGNNPVIPPRSYDVGYSTWEYPKLIIGEIWGFKRWNTLEQCSNGDLYIKGINGWDGTNATPDGTSHLQGYLNGLDTRITNNTTAIGSKQDVISAGDGIDVTNNVVSVDNTIAKKTDVYTKNETDSLLGGKQNTLTAGTGIDITNNVISATGGIDPSAYVRKTNIEDPDPYIDPGMVVIGADMGVGIAVPSDPEQGFDFTNLRGMLSIGQDGAQFIVNAPIPEGEGYLTNPSMAGMVIEAQENNTGVTLQAANFLPDSHSANDKGTVLVKPGSVDVIADNTIGLKIGDSSDDPNTSIEMNQEAITIKASMPSTIYTGNAEISLQVSNEEAGKGSITVSTDNLIFNTKSAETHAYQFTFNGSNIINVSAPSFTYNGKDISVDPTIHNFTNNESLSLADNTIYTGVERISALEILNWGGTSVVSFNTASSGAITITLPQTIKFAETPTFGNDEHWEIAIRNGYAVYTKYNLV